jgi:hypothetical protein
LASFDYKIKQLEAQKATVIKWRQVRARMSSSWPALTQAKLTSRQHILLIISTLITPAKLPSNTFDSSALCKQPSFKF